MVKAEELVQRCIHPADDISARKLGEPEHRWSYLVFLQILSKYLEVKRELGEYDYHYHYGRESLLHYSRWMLENEIPYKACLSKVEIPTETWPAHDHPAPEPLTMVAPIGTCRSKSTPLSAEDPLFVSVICS